LTIDLPVARFVQTHKTPGFVVDVLESAESFGNGAGVVLLLVAAYFLRTVGGGAMVRLSLVSLGSGLLADAFKLVIARTRPRNFDLHQGILESFGGWLPSANAHTAMQSFPSAHVATAVGLAYGLTYFYPRGKWVFASFTALVFFQRLQTGAHFVSDALAGMAVGWGVAVVLYRMPRVRSWFDSIESPPSAAENAAIPGPSNGR
jgi:membrane-associated phospholipid phosphatase